MALQFHGSEKPTLGIEVEFQLIDPETRELLSDSKLIINECQNRGIEHVKTETHQSMIEIDTPICTTVAQCREQMVLRVSQMIDLGEEMGFSLISAGTHPFHKWARLHITPSERYLYLKEKFRWLMRRMTVQGLHVHVGVSSGDRVVKICNEAIRYLPHMLALSASSPFWQEIDTGMQSCRVGIMESFPYSGLPNHFASWRDFELFYDTLIGIGAITSMKDLYWFVRPSPLYGTVEFRICDAMPTLDETMALVAFTQCLVTMINERIDSGQQASSKEEKKQLYWIAPANQWLAARDGLNAQIIINEEGEKRRLSEDILALTKQLQPIAERLGCQKELSYVAQIVKRGASSDRQRAVYGETESFPAVVDSLIAELRQSL